MIFDHFDPRVSDGTWQRHHHHLSEFFYLLFAFIFFGNLYLFPSLHGDASWFLGLVPSFHSPPYRKFKMFAVRPRFLSSSFFFTSRWPNCPRLSAFLFLFSHLFWKIFLTILSEKIGDFHSTHEDGGVMRRAWLTHSSHFLFLKLIFFHTFCLRVMLHLLSRLPKHRST